MAHELNHRHEGDRRRLGAALGITVLFLILEIAGGILSGSLALLADAGHMAGDVAALGLSLFALWVVARPATAEKTFGFHRVEIVAALANGATLMLIAGLIFAEAYERWREPPQVQGGLMLGIATAGLLANIVSVLILSRTHRTNLNLRGAFLHVVGDLLGSVATVAASLIILGTGWTLADPLISALIGVLIVASAWRLMRDSLNVLLEGMPHGMRYGEVMAAIRAVGGVADLHDLHVWSITPDFPVLTSHVVLADDAEASAVLRTLQTTLADRFGISHATLQLESRQAQQTWVCSGGRCYPVEMHAGTARK
ncbi:MAG: cation transporter [Armatimonadetes bacterium RBG_19FT_COMBO_69_19]|nr:MAG: cation transporter [Armatimonadetes bacterium RBG_19FT_COMBO_69_19]